MTDAGWIILTGILAATSCALLGTFLVLRKMSLLGDALSHAVLPGIAIAFFFSESRAILPMFIGAATFGLLTTLLVEAFHRRWSVPEDASIGIVFTALFALGVVLISVYAGQVDLDQECVLYGEIAYTSLDTLLWNDQDYGPRPVWILSGVLIFNLLFVGLLYKELTLASFDPGLSLAVGVNATLIHYLLMGAVSVTTVASFESVGAILVVAMLIVPGATAYLWSDRLATILGIAVVLGAISAIGGYYLAGLWNSSIAGAMVVVLGALFGVSILVAPRQGLLARAISRGRLSVKVAQDHILLGMVRQTEKGAERTWRRRDALGLASVHPWLAQWALRLLRGRGLVALEADATVDLTTAGRRQGLQLLRGHRLWETYLNQLGLPHDHVHGPADSVEHYLDESLQQEIGGLVPDDGFDPQGKRIPGESTAD
ncbi:MAG: iron ABC transporter [Gemmatimonadetes bacterium]|jgi:manganese/zinc/iron transport system permease protein|nr:iron ABC transporter [Gemmatimonadota bacterium]MBT4609818.1 iron ABC transporter [Gemmatimonadota bacterium]MBT5058010.1 iron ABC transporter [Gemmatimonadota bacterium]MBT5141671.1 iron ABC transporter [Gemmatimonadota bacterium]MBT5590974.1 iron ABC transporter [Gemmatimonadota bacterium]